MAAYGKALDMMSKHSGFTVPEVVAGGLSININFDKLGVKETPVIEGEFSEQGIPAKETNGEGT